MAHDIPQDEPPRRLPTTSALRLALYQPDIPQNTGTILRLGACLGVGIDVIAPTGFDMSDRALRRAALDYLDHVDLKRHADFSEFYAAQRSAGSRIVLLSSRGVMSLYDMRFAPGDVLLLGRESAGVPDAVRDVADASIAIPMKPQLRSLNIAVAAAIAIGEALRQTGSMQPFDERNVT